MATSQVMGQFDAMGVHARDIQTICDNQSSSMQSLGQTLEDLGVAMQGQGGIAMQALGADLKDEGTQLAALYQEHAYKMAQNVTSYENQELDNLHIINSIAAMGHH